MEDEERVKGLKCGKGGSNERSLKAVKGGALGG